MKRLLFLSLFLALLSVICSAQSGLAIINSSDGYINVRAGHGTNSKVLGCLYTDQVFFCDVFDDTGRWVNMVYSPEVASLTNEQKRRYANFIRQDTGSSKKECWMEGFVCKSEFTLLDVLPHIGTGLPDTSDDMQASLKNDSIALEVVETKFEAGKHKVRLDDTIYKTINGKRVSNGLIMANIIDGKKAWGLVGELPVIQLSALKLTIKGRSIAIPESAFNDMFDFRSHLYTFRIAFAPNGTMYITMQASDGAGAYDAAWIIKNGKYLGRYIDTTLD